MSKVIVVGGGLSGLSAAHTVLERGGNVVSLLLASTKYFQLIPRYFSTRIASWACVYSFKHRTGSHTQGNSTKATSGVNGTPTAVSSELQDAEDDEEEVTDGRPKL